MWTDWGVTVVNEHCVAFEARHNSAFFLLFGFGCLLRRSSSFSHLAISLFISPSLPHFVPFSLASFRFSLVSLPFYPVPILLSCFSLSLLRFPSFFFTFLPLSHSLYPFYLPIRFFFSLSLSLSFSLFPFLTHSLSHSLSFFSTFRPLLSLASSIPPSLSLSPCFTRPPTSFSVVCPVPTELQCPEARCRCGKGGACAAQRRDGAAASHDTNRHRGSCAAGRTAAMILVHGWRVFLLPACSLPESLLAECL